MMQKESYMPRDKPFPERSREESFNNGANCTREDQYRKDNVDEKKNIESIVVDDDDDDDGVPYDRGWAWIVVLGYFLLFLVYISHDSWTSVLLIDYLQEFGISVSVVTVMLSLGSLCYCLSTIISTNVLVIKFSTRSCTTFAAILNFSATLLFTVAPNVGTFFVTNLVKFTARGITLIATMILVGFYFKRRRGLATTLGLLGLSTSCICAPPLIRYLREAYGFRGCFLILAGLEMHAVPAAFLLRPINSYKRKKINPELSIVEVEEFSPLLEEKVDNQSEDKASKEDMERTQLMQATIAQIPIENASEMFVDSSLIQSHLSEKNEDVKFTDNANSSETIIQSGLRLEAAVDGNPDLQLEHIEKCNSSKQPESENDVNDLRVRQDTVEVNTGGNNNSENSMNNSDTRMNSKNINEHLAENTKSQNAAVVPCENNSLVKVQSLIRPRHRLSAVGRTSRSSNWSLVTTSTMGSTLNIPHVIEEPQPSQDEKPDSRRLKHCQWVKELIDVSLLKNYIAVMVIVMYILINASAFTVVYLPSYAKRFGVSSQNAAILLTIIGAMDIVGRLFFGFLADLKFVRPHIIVALSSACIGTVTHFVILYDGFDKLVFFSVIHGLLAGAGHNLTTVLIIDLVGIHRLSKLLSMASMFNSFSLIIQHPIQGAVIEATGNFVVTYHYIGTSLILVCCLLLCEPLIRKLQLAKEKRQELEKASRNVTEDARL